jgi:hypothetical protein
MLETFDNDRAVRPAKPAGQSLSLARRLLWFVALWLTSVAALGAVAMCIRWILRA